MVMKRFFLSIAIMLPLILSAVNQTKSWSDGPLTWKDFRGTPLTGVPSYLKTSLEIIPQETREGGKTKIRLAVVARMDKDRSFADSLQRSEQRLRYHQLQFDLLEYYRRDLQNDINTGMTGLEADNKLKYYNGLYNSTIDKISTQTNNGTDDPRLQEWEYYARKRLEESELPPIPEIVPNLFSYGFYLGTGATIPSGNIVDAFSGSWTFTAGLGLGYGNFKLKSDITYGQPKINNINILGIKDQKAIGAYSTYLAISVSVGFTVLDTKRFSITPHLGGLWSSYGWNVGNFEEVEGELKIKNYESPSISNFNWYAGIDFDYHFHTVVSKSAFFLTGRREQFTSSIRLTPFVARGIYKTPVPELRGCQIGFTLAYTGFGRSLGFR